MTDRPDERLRAERLARGGTELQQVPQQLCTQTDTDRETEIEIATAAATATATAAATERTETTKEGINRNEYVRNENEFA